MSCGAFAPLEACRFRDLHYEVQIDFGAGNVDLSDYKFKGEVKNNSVSILDFKLVTDGDVLKISATDLQTSAMPAGRFKYDIKMTDTNGFDSTLLYGTFKVTESITE